MRPSIFLLLFFAVAHHCHAQQDTLNLCLPDIEIWADKCLNGDTDIYGLGDWQCSVTAELDGNDILLRGKITFSEKTNDFTIITGQFFHRINAKSLQNWSECKIISLENKKGSISGLNIGARGFRKFKGKGIIHSANIVTDTFGNDVGKIGGKIKFEPLLLIVKFLYV